MKYGRDGSMRGVLWNVPDAEVEEVRFEGWRVEADMMGEREALPRKAYARWR